MSQQCALYTEARLNENTVRYEFSSFSSAGVVLVGILMVSKRGKLRTVFILKSVFQPSAVVGKGP